MRAIVLTSLMFLCGTVHAGPYFRLKPLRKIDTGAFLKIGTPQGGNVKLGVMTPVIYHDSRDGYWLIPGVDWSLLNMGIIAPTNLDYGSLLIGPAVSLDEPMKALLLRGLDYLPGNKNAGAYGFFREILQPGDDSTSLSVGPMWGLSPNGTWAVDKWRGSLQIGATLSSKWGGPR